ncbi:spermatogenesis-associated protein 31A1-like [Molossus molossus]|uniref:spermatogenesis-associated protein 31A1-like n=1 Tax=Molossus molossus TaxID=27622 RepID=UPI0017477570|nr:spermatogenesis-associated protein 31A1-like [Molossus molossus]
MAASRVRYVKKENTTPPWVTDTIFAMVCGVVLFFVLLPWLERDPSLPPPRRHRNIRKRPVEPRWMSSCRKENGYLRVKFRGPRGSGCRSSVNDKATARALCLSVSSQCESQQEHPSHHPPEASLQEDPTNRQAESNTLSLLSSDEQNLLEIQVTKKINIKNLKENEKDTLYPEQMNPNFHLNPLGNTWKSLGAEQDTTTSQPFRSMKDKQEQLPGLYFLYNQGFSGLPSLHSESLVATSSIPENSSALQSPSFSVNGFLNACPTQLQAKVSPLLSHSQPKGHLEFPPQPLFPSMLQFQLPPVAQVQTQGHLQSSPPALPPSYPPKIRACGVSCPAAQNKPQPWIPREIQHPERPLLQKQLASGWDSSSAVRRSQEVFSPFTSNCPKDSILPENFPISPKCQEQQEHHLQKWPMRHSWELSPKIQEPLELRQHQSEVPGTCQATGKHGPSQPSSCTAGSSKDAQKAGPPLRQGPGKAPGHLPRVSESSLVLLQRVGSGESESDLALSRSDSGSELPRNLDRHLENAQKGHVGGRLGQGSRNLTPVSVHRPWLAVGHSSANADTHMETRNLGTIEGREPCVNTCRGVSFLPRDSRRELEAHLTKFSVRHRWGLPLKLLKAMNLFKVKKAVASPGLQLAFVPSSTCASGAYSIVKSDGSLGKPPPACPGEKVNTEESVPTLARPLPARSPVCEDTQSALGGTPSGDDHGSSTASLTRREGRPPSQSLSRPWQSRTAEWVERGSLGPGPSSAMARNEPRGKGRGGASQGPPHRVTVLDMNLGSQSSRTKEARETMEASSSPALQPELGTNVLAKSEDMNAHVRSLEAAGTSESSLFPRMSVLHNPGKPCLKKKFFNEFKSKGKVQFKNQPQDCPTLMSLAANNLASQVPQGHSQRLPTAHGPASHVLCGLKAFRRSSLRKQEPRISNGQDTWKKQIKMIAPFYKGEECRRPNPREHADGPEKLGTSQATKMSPSAKAEGTGDAVEQEKNQDFPESVFRQRMRLFCQWISPHKEISGEDALQKYKPKSATAQSQGPGKSRLVIDSKIPEAQTVIAAVGQILEEKMAIHHRLNSTKLKGHKQESEAPVYGCFRYPEKGSMMSHSTYSHQANPPAESCFGRDRQVRHTESLTTVQVNDDLSAQSCLPSMPPKKTMSPVHPQQYKPKMPGTRGHHQHCPRHCLSQRGVLPGHRQPCLQEKT